MALTSDVDSKSRFVFLQLPVALQLAASGAIGLYPVIDNLPAVVVYGSMLAIGVVCLYVAASLVGRLCAILDPSTDPTAVADAPARCGAEPLECPE